VSASLTEIRTRARTTDVDFILSIPVSWPPLSVAYRHAIPPRAVVSADRASAFQRRSRRRRIVFARPFVT
jgi:hypothetical protein